MFPYLCANEGRVIRNVFRRVSFDRAVVYSALAWAVLVKVFWGTGHRCDNEKNPRAFEWFANLEVANHP